VNEVAANAACQAAMCRRKGEKLGLKCRVRGISDGFGVQSGLITRLRRLGRSRMLLLRIGRVVFPKLVARAKASVNPAVEMESQADRYSEIEDGSFVISGSNLLKQIWVW